MCLSWPFGPCSDPAICFNNEACYKRAAIHSMQIQPDRPQSKLDSDFSPPLWQLIAVACAVMHGSAAQRPSLAIRICLGAWSFSQDSLTWTVYGNRLYSMDSACSLNRSEMHSCSHPAGLGHRRIFCIAMSRHSNVNTSWIHAHVQASLQRMATSHIFNRVLLRHSNNIFSQHVLQKGKHTSALVDPKSLAVQI